MGRNLDRRCKHGVTQITCPDCNAQTAATTPDPCRHGPDCQRCDLLTWAETANISEVADRIDELETNSAWLRARLNAARTAVAALVPPPADTSSTYFAGAHDGYATAIRRAVKAIDEATPVARETFPYRGPCAFCGCTDARHREVDAWAERVAGGEDPQAVADDHGVPVAWVEIAAIAAGWREEETE